MQAYDAERRKRASRLFHWSLDMPPDDEDMDVRVTRHGFGWRELLVIAGAAIGTGYLFKERLVPKPPQPVVVPDTEYNVRFYDREGNLIDVPRVIRKEAKQ